MLGTGEVYIQVLPELHLIMGNKDFLVQRKYTLDYL